MMRRGEHVFSPISHTHPIALAGDLPKDWEFWQAYDRAMLRACGKLAVLMQDGWQESVGVQAEIAIARELGLPVEFIEHNAPVRRGTPSAQVAGSAIEHRHGFPCTFCGAKTFEEAADLCRGLADCPGDTMSKEVFDTQNAESHASARSGGPIA